MELFGGEKIFTVISSQAEASSLNTTSFFAILMALPFSRSVDYLQFKKWLIISDDILASLHPRVDTFPNNPSLPSWRVQNLGLRANAAACSCPLVSQMMAIFIILLSVW
jgi:hypothetical protein